MSTIIEPTTFPPTLLPTVWSLADVQRHVGGVPIERIRSYPPLGMATEKDLLELHDHNDLHCELVDGVLVEKVMGSHESALAMFLGGLIHTYFGDRSIGIVTGEAGFLRILPDRIRVPDLSVILWEKFPNRRLPRDAVFRIAPDLAVEVISEGNTTAEMALKLDEYRQAGVRLVWYIDPQTRSAVVHTLKGGSESLDENGVLDGGDVLPGFSVPLRKLFDYLPRE